MSSDGGGGAACDGVAAQGCGAALRERAAWLACLRELWVSLGVSREVHVAERRQNFARRL